MQMDHETQSILVKTVIRKRILENPAERQRICLFILEHVSDCRASYEEICPFTLELCSHASKLVG